MISIKKLFSLTLTVSLHQQLENTKCKFQAEYLYRIFDMGTLDWASDAPNFVLN